MARLIVVMLAMVCALVVPASAFPVLGSGTGYVYLPNAQVVAAHTGEVTAAYVHTNGENDLSGLADGGFICKGNSYSLGARIGLAEGKAELGIGVQRVNKSYGDATIYSIAGKYKFYDNSKAGLSSALGVGYSNRSTDMTLTVFGGTLKEELPNTTSVYLTVDKTWPENASGVSGVVTIGANYTNFSSTRQVASTGTVGVPGGFPIDADGNVESQGFVRPLVGVKVSKQDWDFLAEYTPAMSKGGLHYQDKLWSAAVRKAVKPNLILTAGLTTFNLPFASSDTGYFLSAAYAFGK